MFWRCDNNFRRSPSWSTLSTDDMNALPQKPKTYERERHHLLRNLDRRVENIFHNCSHDIHVLDPFEMWWGVSSSFRRWVVLVCAMLALNLLATRSRWQNSEWRYFRLRSKSNFCFVLAVSGRRKKQSASRSARCCNMKSVDVAMSQFINTRRASRTKKSVKSYHWGHVQTVSILIVKRLKAEEARFLAELLFTDEGKLQ